MGRAYFRCFEVDSLYFNLLTINPLSLRCTTRLLSILICAQNIIKISRIVEDVRRFPRFHIFIPRHTINGISWFHVGRPYVRHPPFRPSAVRPSFLDDKLNKYQWIFAKLGIYIDIVEV